MTHYHITINGITVQSTTSEIVARCWVTFYAASMVVKVEVRRG